MYYDAIVVGAGPAGSAAAIQLARSHCNVLLIEKSKHPRHKSCGGGISVRLRPYLDSDFSSLVENRIHAVSIRHREKSVDFTADRPFADLVRRAPFDAYLIEKAANAGVEVRESCLLEGWHESEDGVVIETLSGRDTADFLIAADGANSRIARKRYPEWRRDQAPCLEKSLHLESIVAQPKIHAHEIVLDLSVAKGYGWVFPKSKTAEIGIGIFKGKKAGPRRQYETFLKRNTSQGEAALKSHGAVLPLYHKNRPRMARGRVLLVGDAAALVDPFFGEGIYYAVRSGQMAARAVSRALRHEGDILSYDAEMTAAFYPEFEVADRMAHLIYTFPGFFMKTIQRHPRLMQDYIAVFQGEKAYCDFWRENRQRLFRKLNPFRRFSAASSQS